MCDSTLFDPIKKCLAEELYAEGKPGSHYHLIIDTHLKDKDGLMDQPRKGLLYFEVTGPDPDNFQTSC
jgi:hypothetical protein